jgi:hypothetical protein
MSSANKEFLQCGSSTLYIGTLLMGCVLVGTHIAKIRIDMSGRYSDRLRPRDRSQTDYCSASSCRVVEPCLLPWIRHAVSTRRYTRFSEMTEMIEHWRGLVVLHQQHLLLHGARGSHALKLVLTDLKSFRTAPSTYLSSHRLNRSAVTKAGNSR